MKPVVCVHVRRWTWVGCVRGGCARGCEAKRNLFLTVPAWLQDLENQVVGEKLACTQT